MSGVAKSWSFTLNNSTEEEQTAIKAWATDGKCSLLVVGHEVGAEGTPHLQGCVTFTQAKRLAGCKVLLERAHWEITKSIKGSAEYCRKEGKLLIDFGAAAAKLKEKELVWAEAAKGTSFVAFCKEHGPSKTAMQHYQMAQLVMRPKRSPAQAPTVIWKYGATGSGKTRSVYDAHDLDDIYRPLSFKWWDGYDGQMTVLIDDFRKGWCEFHELLVLLDRYPYTKEIKGGSVGIIATTFYITSNVHPEEMYLGVEGEDVRQLMRRITRVEKYEVDRDVVME